jgi:hypothetical protein
MTPSKFPFFPKRDLQKRTNPASIDNPRIGWGIGLTLIDHSVG